MILKLNIFLFLMAISTILGSAIELAKACNATIISTAEVCGVVSEAGVETMLCIWVGRTNFLLVKCALL